MYCTSHPSHRRIPAVSASLQKPFGVYECEECLHAFDPKNHCSYYIYQQFFNKYWNKYQSTRRWFSLEGSAEPDSAPTDINQEVLNRVKEAFTDNFEGCPINIKTVGKNGGKCGRTIHIYTINPKSIIIGCTYHKLEAHEDPYGGEICGVLMDIEKELDHYFYEYLELCEEGSLYCFTEPPLQDFKHTLPMLVCSGV